MRTFVKHSAHSVFLPDLCIWGFYQFLLFTFLSL